MNTVVGVSAEKIIISNEIMHWMMDVARNEKNIILENNADRKAGYKNEINASVNLVNKKIIELEALADETLRKDINIFNKAWTQYTDILYQVVNYAENNETELASKLSMVDSRSLRVSITELLKEIIDRNQVRMNSDMASSQEAYSTSINIAVALIVLSVFLSIFLTYWIVRTITSRIYLISEEAKKIASRELNSTSLKGTINDELEPIVDSLKVIMDSFREVAYNANEIAKGDYSVRIVPKSEHDFLGIALNKMGQTLEEVTAVNRRHNWLSTGRNLLNDKLRGNQSLEQTTENTITFLSQYSKANLGALYLVQNQSLHLSARFAFSPTEIAKEVYAFGEGLPGQAAVSRDIIHLTNLKQDTLRVTSSVLDAKPENVLVVPFFNGQDLLGVIELAKIEPFTETDIEFISTSMEIVGIAIASAITRKQVHELLEETQRQSEELEVQQEELKQANEELEEQTQNLKHQQEELQVANEELEEQTLRIELKNRELEKAYAEIEKKSQEVEMSSRYKSQFLANMSHELRTPLNSLLILSRDLADNKKGNLDASQVESARIIYKSGNDLLQLINEVLDLSKIEAGKMEVNLEEVRLEEVLNNVSRNFSHIAKEKGLTLTVVKEPQLPECITTDPQRLDQILKNLLSNAIKFTEAGSVTVSCMKQKEDTIAIEVKDTGIGIPPDKMNAIFEAFQQADGSTSRKYGGTGLGLSISKQLVKLLGGEITLQSKVNEGSVFTLILPVKATSRIAYLEQEVKPATPPITIIDKKEEFLNYPSIPDDREVITDEDKSLLIIEDDLAFAATLMNQARAKGFKVLVASSGEDGLLLAEKYVPKAIILDLSLPGIQGQVVLSELKSNPVLRHIPVHIISAMERTLDPIKAGAVEYLMKPIDKGELEEAFLRIENFINRKMKNLLIIEDDPGARTSIKVLIGNGDVKCFEAGSGKEAIEVLMNNNIDCIVLDLGLPDISGFELIKKIQAIKNKVIPPIIIYTGKELSKEENEVLQELAESIIIKGVKSEERLLDETALFLHRTVNNLPDHKKDIIKELYNRDAIFQNKKILVVDDDMRNVFALSKILKEQGMEIVKAENGVKALEALKQHSDIALVLMDVMMPEMDGLEATRRIRAMNEFKDLPVITLTAKAMKEDRKKCIDAGANDYISKPIELDRLLSLMKIWIKK